MEFAEARHIYRMENEEDPVKRQQILDARARNISHNVRCLECGSQSIEESQADIAVLLRKVTLFYFIFILQHLFFHCVPFKSSPYLYMHLSPVDMYLILYVSRISLLHSVNLFTILYMIELCFNKTLTYRIVFLYEFVCI